MTHPSEWLSAKSLSKKLDMPLSTVYWFGKKGHFKATKVGGIVRFHWPSIERTMKNSEIVYSLMGRG